MPCGTPGTTSIRLDCLPSTTTLFPVFFIENYSESDDEGIWWFWFKVDD